MDEINLLEDELQKRTTAIAYGISRALECSCQGKAILEAKNEGFDLQEFVADGHCTAAAKPGVHNLIETQWDGPGEGLSRRDFITWFMVNWKNHALEVVTVTWKEFHYDLRWQWIIAENTNVAEEFFEAVCAWCHEVRGEVLVFSSGCWQKNAELFHAIAGIDFSSLVLHGNMKQEILGDFEQFLASRQIYEHYGVPWKRGALFLGPPGNGKTYCVKAIVHALGIPCLYVQSFKAPYDSDEQSGIKTVFQRARKSAPCLLVLEDIDTLLAAESRAFFLNELDGFAENSGLITLATSNHPERLDPSLLDRPSRFDRKYFFGLPGTAERMAYLLLWHNRLANEEKLSAEELGEVVDLTEGFSYAYLKELILSSLMSWISSRVTGGMASIVRIQAAKLREQMS